VTVTEEAAAELRMTDLDRLWDALAANPCQSDDFLLSLDVMEYEEAYLEWWRGENPEP